MQIFLHVCHGLPIITCTNLAPSNFSFHCAKCKAYFNPRHAKLKFLHCKSNSSSTVIRVNVAHPSNTWSFTAPRGSQYSYQVLLMATCRWFFHPHPWWYKTSLAECSSSGSRISCNIWYVDTLNTSQIYLAYTIMRYSLRKKNKPLSHILNDLSLAVISDRHYLLWIEDYTDVHSRLCATAAHKISTTFRKPFRYEHLRLIKLNLTSDSIISAYHILEYRK